MAERGTGRDQSECRDNPRVGEGWFVAENKGLDEKGPGPVTTLRLARGDLCWKIEDYTGRDPVP
jgi:hypothetical protein